MKKHPGKILLICLLMAALLVPAWPGPLFAAIRITDAAGQTVTLEKIPARIVVVGTAPFIVLHMLHMFDETKERLAGFEVKTKQTDDFLALVDPHIQSKKHLGSNPGPESVAALKPDFVISKGVVAGPMARSLKILGIPVLYLGAETPNMFLKDIENLGFAYDSKGPPLISEMNIRIQPGTVAAILGANGAGKTTLLSLLLGRCSADTGKILFSGKPKSQYAPGRIKRMIGMVSQDQPLSFAMSVAEYVLLGRAPHLNMLSLPGPADRDAAKMALATVGMAHMADHVTTCLSSGELQLVHVARALAQAPEILLLDEPCSHLDLVNSRRMLRLMTAIAGQGKIVVFTTHDPNAAAVVANQVILLRKGKLVAAGSPDKTLTQNLLTITYGDAVEVINTPSLPYNRCLPYR